MKAKSAFLAAIVATPLLLVAPLSHAQRTGLDCVDKVGILLPPGSEACFSMNLNDPAFVCTGMEERSAGTGQWVQENKLCKDIRH